MNSPHLYFWNSQICNDQNDKIAILIILLEFLISEIAISSIIYFKLLICNAKIEILLLRLIGIFFLRWTIYRPFFVDCKTWSKTCPPWRKSHTSLIRFPFMWITRKQMSNWMQGMWVVWNFLSKMNWACKIYYKVLG